MRDGKGDSADAPSPVATWDGVAGRAAWPVAPTKPQPARPSATAGNPKINRRRIQTSVSGPSLSHI